MNLEVSPKKITIKNAFQKNIFKKKSLYTFTPCVTVFAFLFFLFTVPKAVKSYHTSGAGTAQNGFIGV